jgi:hypothetical protein
LKFRTAAVCVSVLVAALVTTPRSAHAIDPTTADCLSANDTSIQARRQHRLRAAREQLLVCAAPSCPADIRNECIRRVAEVNAAMPTIVFEAKDASGQDLGDVRVTMDGQSLVERLEGTALSIDPGEHAFTFEAAGQALLVRQFVIREGEKDRRERISFGSGQITAPRPGEPEQAPGLGTPRILAIASAAVGLVALGVGTAFGLQSISKHDDALRACPNACSDQAGVDLWRDAQSAGNVSTVGFVVGAAALAAGGVLWFMAKPAPGGAASPGVGLGPGSILVKGAW